MTLKFIGKKEGMTQFFDEDGNLIPCTLISIDPHHVTQVKGIDTDGYTAIQLGSRKKRIKSVSKALQGHFAKSGVEPCAKLVETRMENTDEYQVGQELTLEYFSDMKFIDVSGVSKGKGFQGVMKLHGFSGGPASHGSGFHRHAGSTGMRSTPGRCFAGGKRASHMGVDAKTVDNIRIIHVDVAKKILVVKGSIPGSKGSLLTIRKAKKK